MNNIFLPIAAHEIAVFFYMTELQQILRCIICFDCVHMYNEIPKQKLL
jgi:hypothetical protein